MHVHFASCMMVVSVLSTVWPILSFTLPWLDVVHDFLDVPEATRSTDHLFR